MRIPLAAGLAILLAPALAGGQDHSPEPTTRVDSARRKVIVSLDHIRLAPGDGYVAEEHRAYFEWPVDGWLRGYSIEVFDSAGRILPRTVLHHAGVANYSRRQLAYQMVERLIAAGRETPAISLPKNYGVPLREGSGLGMYIALVNPGDTVLSNVSVRMTIDWTNTRPGRELFPVVLGANENFATERSFDIPPGRSVMSAEFGVPAGGWLRALGAHLHDYAARIELQDAKTGKTIARLDARTHRDGKLLGIGSTRFPFKRRGLELRAGRVYRVRVIHQNPTNETIRGGAMAFFAGAFIPRDPSQWPAIDPENAALQADLAALRGNGAPSAHRHHD